ncbi:MAG: type I restriction endonuclease subunit M [Ideonella sp.]|nr:type I restriction endonuclease subunit M [Ideonella sp.]
MNASKPESTPTSLDGRWRFSPGQLLATPGALAALMTAGTSPMSFMARHLSGDWGDVCAEDAAANERALVCGARLFSVYKLDVTAADDQATAKVWVITEADRACTTILLPSEY